MPISGESNRKIALKQIREEFAQNENHRTRFLREAHITARLEHPGIAPVYSCGIDGNGRLYYAMRMIEGDSLKAAIGHFHAAAETDDARNILQLRRLLAKFIDVCEAVEFAHNRGIIHRDLKPSNVMLGDFGETLVVDWGLAKDLGRQHEEGLCPDLIPESDFNDTEAGNVLGTPGYMSPEQAKGQTDFVGKASDVYSLGAILFSILTGKMPVGGDEIPRDEILARVTRGEIVRPRILNPSAPVRLEAICLKAMTYEQVGRYESARDMANDVERWLAGEPVSAFPEPLRRRIRRWSDRHRTFVTSTVASLFIILVFGSAVLTIWQRQRYEADQQTLATLAKAAQLESAAAHGDLGDPQLWQAALAFASSAVESSNGNMRLKAEAMVKRLSVAVADQTAIESIDAARMAQSLVNIQRGCFDLEAGMNHYREAFKRCGIEPLRTPVSRAADLIIAKPEEVRTILLAALGDWASLCDDDDEWTWLEDVLDESLSVEQGQAWIRHAARQGDRESLKEIAAKDNIVDGSTTVVLALADALSLEECEKEALQLLRRAQRKNPGDFWINHKLADISADCNPPQLQDAITFFTVAVAIRPKSAGARVNLGTVIHEQGQVQEAIGLYREAIALEPGYATANYNLALALQGLGQIDMALNAFREAVRIGPVSASMHASLATALYDKQLWAESLAECRSALAVEPEHADARNVLGLVLIETGKVDDAIAEFQRVIAYSPHHVLSYINLGNSLHAKGDFTGAISAYSNALELAPEHARAHNNLANAYRSAGQLTASVEHYRTAIKLDPDKADVHSNLGAALRQLGELDAAIDEFQIAIQLEPMAKSYDGLGSSLLQKGQVVEAIDPFREAVAVDSNYFSAHHNLGHALLANRDLPGAITEYEVAIRLRPDSSLAHKSLANALKQSDRLQDAESH